MRILIIAWLLLIYWIAAIFSVSIYESFSVTLQNWLEPSNYFYLFKQLYNILFWLFAASFVFFVPLKRFKNHKFIFFVLIIIILLQRAVFLPWIGVKYNWARWRIDIPWLPSIQPAEFFKLWYVIFFSSRLIRKQKMINEPEFIPKFILLNAILLFVFLLIPDLGTVLVIWLTALVMIVYAWFKIHKAIIMSLVGIVIFILSVLILPNISHKFDYLSKRFWYFISKSNEDINRWVWRQNYQAIIAIGGWWFRWQWYWKWLQKFGYIPEAQSDFIFAAFSEEVGFIWNLILLTLYFLLIRFTIQDISKLKDQHLKILWIWILSLIAIQVFVNIWVNIKILPNTWLTLPFISYWWTAIMVNLIEIVLLYKITQWQKIFELRSK